MSNVRKKRYVMPRPRKYDYKVDYPIKFFLTLPVKLVNELNDLDYEDNKIPNLVEKLLLEFVEKNSKKD